MNAEQEKISRIIRKKSSKDLYLEDFLRKNIKQLKKFFGFFGAIKFQIKKFLGIHNEKDVFERALRYGITSLSFIERYKYLNKSGNISVPQEIRNRILEKVNEISPLAKEIGLRQFGGGKLYQPVSNKIEAIANNVDEFYSSVEITKHTLLDNIHFSYDSLFSDENSEMDIIGHIIKIHSENIKEMLENVFLYGNGRSESTGIFENNELVKEEASNITRNTAGYITTNKNDLVDALIKAVDCLKPSYRLKAEWIMNSRTAKTLNQLKDKSGNYITNARTPNDIPERVLDHKIIINEQMPNINEELLPYAIVLCHPEKLYRFFISKKATVSRYEIPTHDRIGFVIKEKWGGAIVDSEAIKFIKITENN